MRKSRPENDLTWWVSAAQEAWWQGNQRDSQHKKVYTKKLVIEDKMGSDVVAQSMKPLLGRPVFPIRVPRIKARLCFSSSFLLTHMLGGRRWWPWLAPARLGHSHGFLTPHPSFCGHLGSEQLDGKYFLYSLLTLSLSLSLSVCLSNK